MQFKLALLLTLLTSAFASPVTLDSKRDLFSLDINPDVDLDVLDQFKDFCVGIAVCNPVTVSTITDRELFTLDIDPNVEINVLQAFKDLCVGIAVCNPVTVSTVTNNESTCDS